MSSDFGNEEFDLREGGSAFDGEESISLPVLNSISLAGASLFALLKKESTFEWTPECETAFILFKEYLSCPPILYKLEVGHRLYLYLLVSNAVIANALIWEDSR